MHVANWLRDGAAERAFGKVRGMIAAAALAVTLGTFRMLAGRPQGRGAKLVRVTIEHMFPTMRLRAAGTRLPATLGCPSRPAQGLFAFSTIHTDLRDRTQKMSSPYVKRGSAT